MTIVWTYNPTQPKRERRRYTVKILWPEYRVGSKEPSFSLDDNDEQDFHWLWQAKQHARWSTPLDCKAIVIDNEQTPTQPKSPPRGPSGISRP